MPVQMDWPTVLASARIGAPLASAKRAHERLKLVMGPARSHV